MMLVAFAGKQSVASSVPQPPARHALLRCLRSVKRVLQRASNGNRFVNAYAFEKITNIYVPLSRS